ncbi:hypothetical protein VPH35_064683 [Triticum aestivum]
MTAASDKCRKDVAELERGLEHNGDIHLLPTLTARPYTRLRSRRVQCAPITRTGRVRLATAAYCPAPSRPPCRHAVTPRRHAMLRPRATTQRLRGLLTVPPQPPRPPHHVAHLHRPTHSPELHRAAAGERRHRRHTSGKGTTPKMNQLMIPIIGTAAL